MKAMPKYLRKRGSAGFTLIEVMIALLIGLIGIIVMMQTFAVSEGYKRTATSGTDAQINGGIALYMLQRELRLAGFGMNDLMTKGCQNVRVWNNVTGAGFDMHLVPFEINPAGIPAGDANTDTMLVAYGTSGSFVSGVTLTNYEGYPNAGNPTAPVSPVSNYDSFQNGDLFVSVVPGGGVGGNPSCVLHEATATWSASGNCGFPPAVNGTVEFGAVTYQKHTPAGCVSTVATYNSPSGIKDASGNVVPFLTYPTSQVFDLGALVVHVYAIRNGNLTMCDWIAADCTAAANYNIVVNDIVSLRGVYGMNLTPTVSATMGDGVTTPSRAALTTNVYLPSRVMAATIEVTARNSLLEKAAPNGACSASDPTKPGRPDRAMDWIYQTSVAGANIDLSSLGANWACYRYKLFQTSVPLRNMIWRPS